MKEKSIWFRYFVCNRARVYWNAVLARTGIGRAIESKFHKETLDKQAAHDIIRSYILSGTPALISRFGCIESRCLGEGYGISFGLLKRFSKSALQTIHNNAGVFPHGETAAYRFFEITRDVIRNIDLLGVWTTEMHDYLVNEQCRKDVVLTDLANLDPFDCEHPWTEALKGKKVLVVHPFQESIEQQYKKRELLFENPNVLPAFELTVVKAVQTIASQQDARFETWEQALQYMYDECMKRDFDVAVLGCGAYGMPLASMLKDAGKVAIHLGGVTQMLFGIKGGRWDVGPAAAMYNEHWVRPLPSETPQKAVKVEEACYW